MGILTFVRMASAYRLDHLEAEERTFRCARCGAQARAQVLGEGRGLVESAESVLPTADDHRRGKADAFVRSQRSADRRLGLAPCPTCGGRAFGARLAALLAALGNALPLGAVVFILGLGLARTDSIEEGARVGLPWAGAAWVLGTTVGYLRRLRDARRYTLFLD